MTRSLVVPAQAGTAFKKLGPRLREGDGFVS